MRLSRLGRHRRALLRDATRGRARITLADLPDAANDARRRAARDLIALGFASVSLKQARSSSGAFRELRHLELTALGRRVVETFAIELRTGSRLRWRWLDRPAKEHIAVL